MALKSIRIENFKSIGEIEIVNPQPFSVLVGANAAGKSNIFAALQFLHHLQSFNNASDLISAFGGVDNLTHNKLNHSKSYYGLSYENYWQEFHLDYKDPYVKYGSGFTPSQEVSPNAVKETSQFVTGFSRLFVRNDRIRVLPINDDTKLAPDASNLEKVLKRILNDNDIKDDFIETLQLFIPGLDKIEVVSSEFSSNLDLLVYEKALSRPLNKELISDGTYNIIAILTALYQSKTPQFLCIEEPENGLNPYVVKELVNICRDLCDQYGHYIWLNTHSPSLVSKLQPEDIILVNKIDGLTRVKQFRKGSFYGLPMDEAWLTNVLGGGLPW
ncbi:AAA family ATPase [soil metagenome]